MKYEWLKCAVCGCGEMCEPCESPEDVRCHYCWWVEQHIDRYLESPKARVLIERALAKAEARVGQEETDDGKNA